MKCWVTQLAGKINFTCFIIISILLLTNKKGNKPMKNLMFFGGPKKNTSEHNKFKYNQKFMNR